MKKDDDLKKLGVFWKIWEQKVVFPLFFQKKSVAYFVPWIKNGSSGHEKILNKKKHKKTHNQNHDPFLIHGTRFSKNVKNDFCNLVADSRFH